MPVLILLLGKAGFKDHGLAVRAKAYACNRAFASLPCLFKLILCLWRDKDINPALLFYLIIGIGLHFPGFQLAAVKLKVLYCRLCRHICRLCSSASCHAYRKKEA